MNKCDKPRIDLLYCRSPTKISYAEMPTDLPDPGSQSFLNEDFAYLKVCKIWLSFLKLLINNFDNTKPKCHMPELTFKM